MDRAWPRRLFDDAHTAGARLNIVPEISAGRIDSPES